MPEDVQNQAGAAYQMPSVLLPRSTRAHSTDPRAHSLTVPASYTDAAKQSLKQRTGQPSQAPSFLFPPFVPSPTTSPERSPSLSSLLLSPKTKSQRDNRLSGLALIASPALQGPQLHE